MNQELLDVMKVHAQWFTKRFGETRPSYYLFPAGERWPSDPTRPTTSFKTAWRNLLTAADVQCRIHDLRHTAGSRMAQSGVDIYTIAKILGHKTLTMTMRYSHHNVESLRHGVDALSAAKV